MQGQFPSEGNILFPYPMFPFWLLVMAHNPRGSLTFSCITPVSASIFTHLSSFCVSLSPQGLLISIPVIEFRAHLIQGDLILTTYIYKGFISKYCHILRFWIDLNIIQPSSFFNPFCLTPSKSDSQTLLGYILSGLKNLKQLEMFSLSSSL